MRAILMAAIFAAGIGVVGTADASAASNTRSANKVIGNIRYQCQQACNKLVGDAFKSCFQICYDKAQEEAMAISLRIQIQSGGLNSNQGNTKRPTGNLQKQ